MYKRQLLTHVRVAGTFYSRSAEVLDLRFADITTADYEKLRKKVPNSEILWRIPFQGKTYDQNTDVLYVTCLLYTSNRIGSQEKYR